jgi:sulfotransferase
MKQYHFISGLPRAGSSLLSSILRQNPKIYADIASPVNAIVGQLLHTTSDGFNKILTENKVKELIKSTFDVMYNDNNEDIIFDTNRCWSGKTDIIHDVFPDAKIICCVRGIPDILNSFENNYRKNMYKTYSPIYGDASSVYSRCAGLIHEQGVLGAGLTNLNQGLHSVANHILCIIEYDELISNTNEVLDLIYGFLETDRFDHDLSNIPGLPNIDVIDTELNLIGLHEVRPTINRRELPQLLPHDLVQSYSNMEYWRQLFAQYNTAEDTE